LISAPESCILRTLTVLVYVSDIKTSDDSRN
jgi:hypothetical protein